MFLSCFPIRFDKSMLAFSSIVPPAFITFADGVAAVQPQVVRTRSMTAERSPVLCKIKVCVIFDPSPCSPKSNTGSWQTSAAGTDAVKKRYIPVEMDIFPIFFDPVFRFVNFILICVSIGLLRII